MKLIILNEIRDIRARQQEKQKKSLDWRKDTADKLMQMTERDIKQELGRLVSSYNMTQWMTLKRQGTVVLSDRDGANE